MKKESDCSASWENILMSLFGLQSINDHFLDCFFFNQTCFKEDLQLSEAWKKLKYRGKGRMMFWSCRWVNLLLRHCVPSFSERHYGEKRRKKGMKERRRWTSLSGWVVSLCYQVAAAETNDPRDRIQCSALNINLLSWLIYQTQEPGGQTLPGPSSSWEPCVTRTDTECSCWEAFLVRSLVKKHQWLLECCSFHQKTLHFGNEVCGGKWTEQEDWISFGGKNNRQDGGDTDYRIHFHVDMPETTNGALQTTQCHTVHVSGRCFQHIKRSN